MQNNITDLRNVALIAVLKNKKLSFRLVVLQDEEWIFREITFLLGLNTMRCTRMQSN